MGGSLLTISKGTWIESHNQQPHTSDNLMRSMWNTSYETAVAQFVIPQNLRYKRFTNATLIFYTTAPAGSTIPDDWKGTGCRISNYKTGDTLDQLIWANVEALGERGEIVDVEPLNWGGGDAFPHWRYLDITGMFLNGVVDGTYYTVMINAYPGMYYGGYCGIGNASLTDYETKLSLTYEDVPQLPPSPSYPVGTYVSENTDLLFAWTWEATTGATQAAVQLEYKPYNVLSFLELGGISADNGGEISANNRARTKTFNLEKENIKIEVSDSAEYGVFFYNESSSYIGWTGWITSTTYTTPTGAKYARAVMRYSDNRVLGQSELVALSRCINVIIVLTQTTHTYLLSGGLPQGVYQWRIKGTNDAGEVSDYSSIAEFNVVGQPAAPVIANVPNRALTEITWTTADQNAFDIQITDSANNVIINDSVASSTASYKPNIFLKGTYTAKVRVRNSTGLVSDWGTKSFTINAAGPTAPTIQLYQNDTHVRIITTTASSTNYAVVRINELTGEEEILGKMTGGEFTDSTFSFGIPYKYIVRAWASGGYTDSTPARICYGKTAVVLETDDDELIIDKSEETYLPYTEDDTGETAVYNCIGRELPVVEHGAFESIAFKTRLFITNDEKPRLAAMKKKNRIYYRDYSGRAFPVAIQPPISFERWMDNGYMADIQFIRIADTEVVINV